MTDHESDAELPARPTVHELDFDGDPLVAVVIDGDGVAIPVRAICGVLGLDSRYQLTRLREHDTLCAGLREVRVAQDGRIRVVAALLHKYIPYWLATVTPNQVRAELRPKLERYQRELVDLLAAIYSPDLSPLPTHTEAGDDPTLQMLQQQLADMLIEFRLARQALLDYRHESQQQSKHVHERLHAVEDLVDTLQQQIVGITPITAAQQEYLKRSIQRLASQYQKRTGKSIYGQLFAEFCKTMGTPRYAALPAKKYDDALMWLQSKAAALFPDDPDALPPLQKSLL